MTIGVGLGIGLGLGCGIRTQARQAAAIPVAGAVVIAPLWNSLANYGSLGGSLTQVGAPSLSSTHGATFNGSTDAAYIVTGAEASVTCVFRARTTSTAGELAPVGVLCNSGSPGNNGIAFERYGGHWNTLLYGTARVTGAVGDDANSHVFAITRSLSGTTLHVDGVLSASSASPGNASNTLVLAAKYYPFTWSNFAACSIKNLAMYHSALSASDRALVEAWAR